MLKYPPVSLPVYNPDTSVASSVDWEDQGPVQDVVSLDVTFPVRSAAPVFEGAAGVDNGSLAVVGVQATSCAAGGEDVAHFEHRFAFMLGLEAILIVASFLVVFASIWLLVRSSGKDPELAREAAVLASGGKYRTAIEGDKRSKSKEADSGSFSTFADEDGGALQGQHWWAPPDYTERPFVHDTDETATQRTELEI